MTLPIFNEHLIQQFFDTQTYQRGLTQIYQQGKVGKLELHDEDEEGGSVEVEVKGSGHRFYWTEVEIYHHQNQIQLASFCDCPVGKNCKHGVAVALELLHNPKYAKMRQKLQLAPTSPSPTSNSSSSNNNPKFNAWLQALHKEIQGGFVFEEALERWFRFRLFAKTQGNFSIAQPPLHGNEPTHIEIMRHQYTKTGRLSKPKTVTLSEAEDQDFYYVVDDLSKRALKIAKSCQQSERNYYSNPKLYATGAEGFFSLKYLIQQGLADFQNFEQPLKWSDTPFSLEWQFTETTKIPSMGKLQSNLPKSHFLALCEPPILINIQTLTACEVQSVFPAVTVQALLRMPEANIEQLEVLADFLDVEKKRAQQLIPQTPSLPLPTIPGAKVVTIQTKPTGILRLLENSAFPKFENLFLYDEITLSPRSDDAIIRQRLNGKKFELHRDMAAEQALEALLLPYLFQLKELAIWQAHESLDSQTGMQRWLEFQNAVPELEQQGWEFIGLEALFFKVDSIETIEVSAELQENWFELRFDFSVQGEKLSLANLLAPLLAQYNHSDELPEQLLIQTDEQKLLSVDKGQIAPIFNALIELLDTESNGTYRLAPFESHLIAGLENLEIQWHGAEQLRELSRKLAAFTGIQAVNPPQNLQATLRDYQQFGLNWLNFLHEYQFNGILADDMGLGKTLQTLTFIQHLKETEQLHRPVLLVIPTSLIANWKSEAARFTPQLRITSLQGSERHQDFDKIGLSDLVISTYPLIPRDLEILSEHTFEYVILDEAQKIKNPKTQLYKALQTIKSQHRLCLTGTPVENNLTELWSLFNFLMPGFLGNLPQFKQRFQKPIEQDKDFYAQQALNRRIKPFLLRRTKHEVVKELPDKTEIIRYAEFDTAQANLYETIRISMEEKVKQAVAQKGLAKSHIALLDALLKLRQVCCDPSLVKIDAAKKVKHSAKLELFMELIEELLEGKHRILVFSQFTSMLKIIESQLTKAKIGYSLLTGQTKDRETAINQFREGKTSVFLISLKTGGVGLNLTEADTVIHYDPWWNPAVENQATDRAYRIGQDKEVFVYKLVAANTIEEKILQLQAQKQTLQDQLYASGNSDEQQANLSGTDLLDLLKAD